MTHGANVIRHHEKVKECMEKHDLPPPASLKKRIFHRAVYFVALLGPIMSLPQLFKILFEKDVSGVSFISWASYFFISCFWIAYGVEHREPPIILTNVAWAVVSAAIAASLIMHG